MTVRLKICLPDKNLQQGNDDKIVLPIESGTFTVIEERAPTMLLLSAGAVQLLDKSNRTVKRWFINGGFADIADNECVVATDKAVNLESFSLSQAEEKAKDDVFYQKVYDYLKVFG